MGINIARYEERGKKALGIKEDRVGERVLMPKGNGKLIRGMGSYNDKEEGRRRKCEGKGGASKGKWRGAKKEERGKDGGSNLLKGNKRGMGRREEKKKRKRTRQRKGRLYLSSIYREMHSFIKVMFKKQRRNWGKQTIYLGDLTYCQGKNTCSKIKTVMKISAVLSQLGIKSHVPFGPSSQLVLS